MIEYYNFVNNEYSIIYYCSVATWYEDFKITYETVLYWWLLTVRWKIDKTGAKKCKYF